LQAKEGEERQRMGQVNELEGALKTHEQHINQLQRQVQEAASREQQLAGVTCVCYVCVFCVCVSKKKKSSSGSQVFILASLFGFYLDFYLDFYFFIFLPRN
jgi:hypothetical protein